MFMYMYSLQIEIHKQANRTHYVQFQGNQNVPHFRMLSSSSRLDEFQTRNLPPNARNQWWAPLLLLLRRAA